MAQPQNQKPTYSKTWEVIGGHIWRLKVPGGWLVRISGDKERNIVYIPDPNAEWIFE